MDLVAYLPDPQYDRYRYGYNSEYNWIDLNKSLQTNKVKKEQPAPKEPKKCSICEHNKKRALNNYITKRTRTDSERDTCIQEEEESVENDNIQEVNNHHNQQNIKNVCVQRMCEVGPNPKCRDYL